MLLSRMNLWGAMAIIFGLFKDTANTAFSLLRCLRQMAVRHRKHRVSIYVERGVLRYRHADQFEVGYGR